MEHVKYTVSLPIQLLYGYTWLYYLLVHRRISSTSSRWSKARNQEVEEETVHKHHEEQNYLSWAAEATKFQYLIIFWCVIGTTASITERHCIQYHPTMVHWEGSEEFTLLDAPISTSFHVIFQDLPTSMGSTIAVKFGGDINIFSGKKSVSPRKTQLKSYSISNFTWCFSGHLNFNNKTAKAPRPTTDSRRPDFGWHLSPWPQRPDGSSCSSGSPGPPIPWKPRGVTTVMGPQNRPERGRFWPY